MALMCVCVAAIFYGVRPQPEVEPSAVRNSRVSWMRVRLSDLTSVGGITQPTVCCAVTTGWDLHPLLPR